MKFMQMGFIQGMSWNLNIWGVFWTNQVQMKQYDCGKQEEDCRCHQVLDNARALQLECASVLHETSLVPVPMYGSETMLQKEQERSRVRAVQMDNLRGLLRIRRMNRVPGQGSYVEWRRAQMKGLMKAFSGGLAMRRGIGLPRESTVCRQVCWQSFSRQAMEQMD